MATTVQTALIGCGGMARLHLRSLLQQRDTTTIKVVSEPDPDAYAAFARMYSERGLDPPPNEPDLARLLSGYDLDAAFIITPHACHHDHARDCLEAGLDVLLEKPMVMTAAEAESLISIRDRTGRLLVVAFPGSLSPEIRAAERIIRSSELGELLSITATVWQNWAVSTTQTWRQEPALSGGGFLFDTGAHMLNTVVDLAGEEFHEVAAWMDHRGRPVEILSVVIGRLASGTLVTLHACGDTIPSCASDVRVFGTKGILRTGVWGGVLELQKDGEPALAPVAMPASLGVWEQFLAVRQGKIPNPCPPEVGLRMARLYDAIKVSAAREGMPVRCLEA